MSVLEIVLYVLIGGGVLTYVTFTIIKIIKNRKKGSESDETKVDE